MWLLKENKEKRKGEMPHVFPLSAFRAFAVKFLEDM
jgi:hypothetical protein